MFFIYYYFILIIYICCAKKSKKRKKNKIKSQSRHSKRQERKKKLKKNIQSRQPVTDWHVSGKCSFPPFETAGMGKTTKKKPQKWNWIILEFFFQRGSDLKIFLAIGLEKKFIFKHSFDFMFVFKCKSFFKLLDAFVIIFRKHTPN